MGDDVFSLIINGSSKKRDIKRIIKSIQDNEILTIRGGFLFRASLRDAVLHMGIIPSFINGERGHHYDIGFDFEDPYRLTGSFNSDGTINIITIPGSVDDINEEYRKEIKRIFQMAVTILINSGYSSDTRVDWITKKVLEELKLFKREIMTVKDIINSP